ncbi:MFS transporter [Streptomyces sp. NPDC050448]|uniref:MFS transporter n=1 Tax=Streptomyces sp. NPDC050448 TaxID=3155404 RepID=UPI0034180640
MSGSAAAPGGFRGVFALGGSALPVYAFLARLPAALCPIGTLLLINERDGIGDAGTVAAALWLGQALGGPVIGRLADRRGHRPVLLAACAANAAVLAALVTAVLGGLPLPAEMALAVAAGLTVPQVGPLARARWAHLAGEDEALVGAALSFDTTLDEVGFAVGPALAGILAVTVHPASALVLAAGLILLFGTLFAVHPTAPGPAGAPARRWPRRRRGRWRRRTATGRPSPCPARQRPPPRCSRGRPPGGDCASARRHLLQPLLQPLGVHHRRDLDLGVELREQALEQRRHLRAVLHVEDDPAGPDALGEPEVGGLRLEGIHELLHDLGQGAALDGLVAGRCVDVGPEHDSHA